MNLEEGPFNKQDQEADFDGNPNFVVVDHELATPDGVEGPTPVYVKPDDTANLDDESLLGTTNRTAQTGNVASQSSRTYYYYNKWKMRTIECFTFVLTFGTLLTKCSFGFSVGTRFERILPRVRWRVTDRHQWILLFRQQRREGSNQTIAKGEAAVGYTTVAAG